MKIRHVQIPVHVLQSGISRADLGVYVALRSFLNRKTRKCYPSKERLAGIFEKSDDAINKNLKNLREAGLIDWISGSSMGRANEYTFIDAPSIIREVDRKKGGVPTEKVRHQQYENNINKQGNNDFCLDCHVYPCVCDR